MRTSIGARLSRLVVAAVFLGITSTVVFFLIGEFRQTVTAERIRLENSAAAFAAAAAEGVHARDQRAVLEVLRGVRAIPDVRYVAARTAAGLPIAEIGSGALLVKENTYRR